VIENIAQLPDLIDHINDNEQLELVNESPAPNQEDISLILGELLKEDTKSPFDCTDRRVMIGWIFENVHGGLADSPKEAIARSELSNARN
jgi:hypothetical protein